MSKTYVMPIKDLVVVGYSSQYSSSYGAAMTIDGNTSTYWRCNVPTGAYVTLGLAEAKAATHLRIYVANTTYYATSWTLAGSQDSEIYTDIATGTCTGVSGWQSFDFPNATEYLFYRWTCNTGNSSRLYVSEIVLQEDVAFEKEHGKYIALSFDEDLIGDPTGEQPIPIGGWIPSTTEVEIVGVVSSGDYATTNSVSNILDNSNSTYWRCSSGSAVGSYLVMQFHEPIAISGFQCYQGNNYYPQCICILGSDDGENWTELGTATNTSSTAGWKSISFCNGNAYLYYKLVFTACSSTSTLYVYGMKAYLAKGVGNEKAFTVSGMEYGYSPDGTLESTTYVVTDIALHPTMENTIVLEVSDVNRFSNAVGQITVTYDSSLGNLVGYGGAVESFTTSFLPTGLVWKGHHNRTERIEVHRIDALGSLTRIYYTDRYGPEHLAISEITAVGSLIHINDI